MVGTNERPPLAIIGAGIMGRLLAYQLAPAYAVTVFEGRGEHEASGASFAAGGMLAPYSELETFDDQLLELSLASLGLWRTLADHKDFAGLIGFPGTVICHQQGDGNLASHLAAKWQRLSCADAFETLGSAAEKLPWARHRGHSHNSHMSGKALFVACEGVVDNAALLHRLRQRAPGADYRFGCQVTALGQEYLRVTSDAGEPQRREGPFAAIIDARGIAAKGELKELRGVRGEAVVVEAREDRDRGDWSQQPVVRLLHPRYPIYVIPRPKGRYIIGASTIESEDAGPITVRSLLELLSAAFAVDPALAEARVVATRTGVRAAFDDNLPQVARKGTAISVNGLYRHGFLLAPILAEAVKSMLAEATDFRPAITNPRHEQLVAAICSEVSHGCYY